MSDIFFNYTKFRPYEWEEQIKDYQHDEIFINIDWRYHHIGQTSFQFIESGNIGYLFDLCIENHKVVNFVFDFGPQPGQTRGGLPDFIDSAKAKYRGKELKLGKAKMYSFYNGDVVQKVSHFLNRLRVELSGKSHPYAFWSSEFFFFEENQIVSTLVDRSDFFWASLEKFLKKKFQYINASDLKDPNNQKQFFQLIKDLYISLISECFKNEYKGHIKKGWIEKENDFRDTLYIADLYANHGIVATGTVEEDSEVSRYIEERAYLDLVGSKLKENGVLEGQGISFKLLKKIYWQFSWFREIQKNKIKTVRPIVSVIDNVIEVPEGTRDCYLFLDFMEGESIPYPYIFTLLESGNSVVLSLGDQDQVQKIREYCSKNHLSIKMKEGFFSVNINPLTSLTVILNHSFFNLEELLGDLQFHYPRVYQEKNTRFFWKERSPILGLLSKKEERSFHKVFSWVGINVSSEPERVEIETYGTLVPLQTSDKVFPTSFEKKVHFEIKPYQKKEIVFGFKIQ